MLGELILAADFPASQRQSWRTVSCGGKCHISQGGTVRSESSLILTFKLFGVFPPGGTDKLRGAQLPAHLNHDRILSPLF